MMDKWSLANHSISERYKGGKMPKLKSEVVATLVRVGKTADGKWHVAGESEPRAEEYPSMAPLKQVSSKVSPPDSSESKP